MKYMRSANMIEMTGPVRLITQMVLTIQIVSMITDIFFLVEAFTAGGWRLLLLLGISRCVVDMQSNDEEAQATINFNPWWVFWK